MASLLDKADLLFHDKSLGKPFMIEKVKQIPRDEITLSRLFAALMRRIRNIPHAVQWRRLAGAGSLNAGRLQAYRDTYRNERCFILGNGPSLAKMDLQPLRRENTFGLNRIYLLFQELDFETTFHVCMNDLVLLQSAETIAKIRAPKFLNWRARNLFEDTPSIHFLNEGYSPQFSKDLTRQVWAGATVTFVAMQIAYYMGFQQVILIGVDHRFKTKGTPHQIIVSGAEDVDHFHPKYFADRTRWQLPDLKTSEYAFQLARDAFEAEGREILDATVGGALQIFPKIDYQRMIRRMD
jgi:hypothetical protein